MRIAKRLPGSPAADRGDPGRSLVPASAAIDLLQSRSLASLVREDLERRIVAGVLAPGAKLNEVDLAEALNVSRGPVREAFRALEQAGLVRVEKNRGVFVRELSLLEADELYEVRAGLDALIGRLAAQRASPAQVEDLRLLLRNMQKAARARSVDDYYPLNLRFHELLCQFTGNATLLSTYRRLVNELHLFRRETLRRGPDSFPTSTAEHAAIIDAIGTGDAEAASRLLHDHAMRSRERLHRMLERPLGRAPADPKRRKPPHEPD